MRSGDQMISLNGKNVEMFYHDKIKEIIIAARASGVLEMEVRYNPARLEDLENAWSWTRAAKAQNNKK